jgi:hypothetical protein
MSSQNLDQLCAKYGWQMADKSTRPSARMPKTTSPNPWACLQEDGVYAFFLYQASRGQRERAGADKIARSSQRTVERGWDQGFENAGDPLAAVRDHLAGDLDQLLLAKRLLEQALIYARYHAKALE